MANENNKQIKRRRRRPGVPTVLVVVLLVIALAMGGLVGFAVARKSDPNRAKLLDANARIMELENTLTLMGFSLDEDDPEEWIFDDTASNGAADLAGNFSGEEAADVWADDGLLSGTLDENSDPVVVAEFDGGQLLSTEVIPEFNDQLTTQIFNGYSADEVSESVLQTVLSYMVSDKIIEQKAKALGLDTITDEDQKAIDAQAAELYNDMLSYYTAFVAEEGMTQDEINAAAAEYMRTDEGITRQSIAEDIKKDWASQKYYDYLVKDVTVSDEEVRQHYQSALAEQKADFAEYPEEYEYTHLSGEPVLYNPEGYRAVRNLMIPFGSDEAESQAGDLLDEIDQLDPTADAAKIQELNAQLDELFKPLEATANEITEKLKAGASFDAMLDEYGADETMKEEPVRSQGYYISENSFMFSAEFVQGSMILDRPGQISSPLRSASGLHLVQYVGDVAPGEVPLEEVFEQMKAAALEIKQDTYYEEQTTALLDNANVRYYPERLQ